MSAVLKFYRERQRFPWMHHHHHNERLANPKYTPVYLKEVVGMSLDFHGIWLWFCAFCSAAGMFGRLLITTWIWGPLTPSLIHAPTIIAATEERWGSQHTLFLLLLSLKPPLIWLVFITVFTQSFRRHLPFEKEDLKLCIRFWCSPWGLRQSHCWGPPFKHCFLAPLISGAPLF